MEPTQFTPISATVGGALIALATGLALVMNGKIAGISGVFGRILRPAVGDTLWRVWFLVGMIGGGAATFAIHSESAAFSPPTSIATMAIAGLLVGLGTRIGGGCTSGHGVCGIARGSTRGITGTVVFMAAAILTVYVTRHMGGAQ
jgi:uncharacterized membrane protein YedE/YeeE